MDAIAPARVPVTVVIAARDEAARIEACIRSAAFASEVIVAVDHETTDDTAERATAAGARVLTDRAETIGARRNLAIAAAKTDWILALDADERCTPEVGAEIATLLGSSPRADAFRLRRRNFFLGREIRHGGWEKDVPIRLFRRTLRYDDRRVHEGIRVTGEVDTLRVPLLHTPYESLDQYFAKLVRYSRWWALDRKARGQRAHLTDIVLRPPARFFTMFVLRSGWRDGMAGAVVAGLAATSVLAKYAQLWALDSRG